MEHLFAVDHGADSMNRINPRMTGSRAERFVVLNLRLMALGFAVVGALFIITPNGVLDAISDLGDGIGDFSRAPETVEKFWLALGFADMVVITGICAVAQATACTARLGGRRGLPLPGWTRGKPRG